MSDEPKPAATSRAAAPFEFDAAHFDLAERAARFGYWRVNLADNTTYWSPGMYQLLGVDPVEMPPDSDWLLDQMLPEDKENVNARIATAIKTRSPFSYRTRARDPEVAAQFVDTQGEVSLGPDGRVTAVIGVCYDVTKQIKAELAREKAQAMYRLMTEEASDIIVLYGEDGRVLFASQALERVLGYTARDIEHQRALALIHPDDIAEIVRIWERPGAGQTLTATFRIRHAAGHYVWIEVTTRAVPDGETGEFRNTVSIARDVTERKLQELEAMAARERAENANKAKSRFLANMSHELRTPLNAVIGFTDLMRQQMFGALGNERYEEYATLIYDSGQLLLDLISDMLDMAKIEAGKLELNMERVDLTGTIEDSVRLLTDRADNNGLEIAVSMPKAPITLTADRRAVKQVLLNLLTNAIKFTPAGGHIDVVVRVEGGRVALSVRDTGIGIPAHELPRLGRPFEQVCGDPMLAKSGTGLGLALVRALVEKHGGQLRIQSEEGVGTEVSVDFPLVPISRAAA
ncbi:MAG: PAS domain-containing sensor histidine kinase [Alphaproteobacteria bacterium]|nr:PAS domain-containing sensor histidine kinase [Alphaproteobacteria bacterium]